MRIMSKMRAMIVPRAGAKLLMEERDVPEPNRHEVRIGVHACGVCRSDSITVEGLMPGLVYPRIPGHEVIGSIEALGPDVDGWKVGSRVGVGWFGGSCGYCGHCRRDDAFACENIHGATGVSRDGGYATHMLALASALAHVPESLDPVESAPLLCAGITTFNALRNCGARAGDLVAIHGVGGLGHLGTRGHWVLMTTSTARRPIRRQRCNRWEAPKRSLPRSRARKPCRRSQAAWE
jgi:alcohol dehydrogenase